MMKRNKGWYFLPFILLLATSCRSTPAHNDLPLEVGLVQGELDAAFSRASGARENAVAVQASVHFPDEWARAESDYRAGREAGRATQEAINQAVSYFTAAADLYELIAGNSAELFARDFEDARNALDMAAARARLSRQGALDAQGPTHFPGDWRSAEAGFQRAEAGERDTFAGVGATTALFLTAADDFDDIAARSRPLMAQAGENARRDMQAALARAEQSRRDAQANRAATHFPAEWRSAEDQLRTGRAAGRGTPDEMIAAVGLLTSLAATYDDLANRSRPLFERDEAQRALNAAVTRAERSRRAAVNAGGETFLPNEWRAADSQNQAAINAPRDTAAQVQAATALFVSAADGFDDIARRSGPMQTAARNEASGALQAATARADSSRQAAIAAEGQTRFPDEWREAEAQNQAGRRGRRTTPDEMREAVALLNSAADGFDGIAQRGGPIVARERAQAENALRTAMARAERSRQAAVAAEGQTHSPADWRNAEAQNNTATRARTTTVAEMQTAAGLFVAAADSFDDIARRSGPIATAARNEANRDFQVAATRAERSRRAAVAVDAQTHFPREWDRAESQNTGGRSAPRTTVAETRAAAAQLNSAADGFDDIAERSGPVFARARDDAASALQAAMARADGSRQAAVDVEAQTFPAEWRTADSQITAARRARRNTPEEMRGATTMFVAAADAFDDIARRSGPMFTAGRNEANSALQSAMARATQSRQRAENTDAATNLPREWRNLETRHRNAENARRATLAEMRSAANLFNGVADGFDGIIQQNVRFAEENQAAALAARATAERERQAAVDARANVTARDDFDRADTTFRQAATAFNDRNFAAARNQYNQSATQFVASVREADRRRRLADAAVEEARRRSAESTAFAISTGLTLEEMEGET